ncbi:MAG TPA: hypothetical protein VF885_21795 [Arthrobacter sp.]
MNENAGSISLSTLDQDVFWIDRHGVQHGLADMTHGYLENTRGHLRRMATALYSLELRRQEDVLFVAELTGWDNGRDAAVLPRDAASAEAWLNNTPLVSAITALLDSTS